MVGVTGLELFTGGSFQEFFMTTGRSRFAYRSPIRHLEQSQ
jgi:hypothetical protein